MVAEGVIGDDRLFYPLGLLRRHPVIDVIAPIAVRPTVEAALLDGGEVVGNKIAAELIPLVDDRPQSPAFGFPGEADRIPQAGREQARFACLDVELEDCRPARFLVESVLAHVAVRADADIKPRAVLVARSVFVQW